MNPILLYSRKANHSIDLLAEQLQSVGFTVDQTQNLNLPRLILNPYSAVHFLIDELPLTVKETVFMTLVKSLGKVTVLSIYNINHKISKKSFDFLYPDALTVSQTNHLKFFRQWNCTKMILPCLPDIQTASVQKNQLQKNCSSFLIPLDADLNEATQYKSDHDVYFDARKLLAPSSSARLRKMWTQLLQNKKISPNFHLVLSNEKITELLEEDSVAVVLANSQMPHTEFTHWLECVVNKNNLVILNDFQATSFSQAWTSGRNCHVVSYHSWVKDVNSLLQNPTDLKIKTFFKSSQMVEPLINDLSRLYTKILHQKTSLLSPPSVNIFK